MEKEQYPYWKKIIYVLTFGWIAIWIYRVALTPIYPQLSEFFNHASKQELGLISSCYFFGYVCTQIPSGILADKFGRKNVLIPGFILFALGTVAVGLSTNLMALYIGSVLAGIGCGTYYGVAYSLTGVYVPKEKKSFATAIVNSGSAMGSGLGLIGSSYAVKQLGLPWQYVIFTIVAIIIIMIVVFIKVIKKDDVVTKAVDHKTLPLERQSSGIKTLFTPSLIATYLVYFVTCYAFYLIDTWLPDFLSSERGLDGMESVITSIVFAAAIPGALIFSKLADKFNDKKEMFILVLELVAAAMLLLAVLATSKPILIICLALYGFFGKLAVEPIIISWISEKTGGKNISTTLGVFNFFGMSSAVIVPWLTGRIDDVMGSKQYAFYLAVILMIIGAIVFYSINRKKQQTSI